MPAVSPANRRPSRRRADLPRNFPAAHVPSGLLAMLEADSPAAAAQHIADDLPCQFDGCQLAIGWAGRNPTCKLLAVTHRPHYDRSSELAQALEAALDESLVRGESLAAPILTENQIPARTHERFLQLHGARWSCSHPLINRRGQRLGSVVVWGEQPESAPAAAQWLAENAPLWTAGLAICQQAGLGALSRVAQTIRQAVAGRNTRAWFVGVGVALALLALPLPHRVRCDCIVEPVVRRFVAAPFDATLDATLVEPGDLVAAGQPIIQLEGREIAWKLAALAAQHKKAQKTHDQALAEREASAAQLAELEVKQLEHEMALLNHRQEHLTMVSPIDGVVLSGDLKRDVGAPVTTGQTLLEIAPLDCVVVEAAVAEDQIALIDTQARATVRLDALPGRQLRGELTTIHPQAELRDNKQIFVAELPLENRDRSLRPGMQGVARVEAGWATLGWKLFHRPYYALTGWLGW